MAKKNEKLYVVEQGYRELCVGTLPQCQRVQSALAACQIVDTKLIDVGDVSDRDVVLVESERGVIVKPTKKRVFTQEEYERENIRKIEMTPADAGGGHGCGTGRLIVPSKIVNLGLFTSVVLFALGISVID